MDSRRARPVPSLCGRFLEGGDSSSSRARAARHGIYPQPPCSDSERQVDCFQYSRLQLGLLLATRHPCWTERRVRRTCPYPSLSQRHNRGCCHVRTRDVSLFRIPANRTSDLLPSLPQRRGLVPRLPGMLPPTYRNPLILIPPKHFHGRYYTGERVDCGSQRCKTSSAHIHGATTSCRCPAVSSIRALTCV